MNFEKITTVFLILAIGLVGYLHVQEQGRVYKRIEDETRNKPFVQMDEVFAEPLTLWWGGVTGQYPKYFEKKGMKGLGWAEFPVFELKRLLNEEFGVNIIDWMLNPSRLDHEFRINRRPVCIYPYKWNHPEKEFTNSKNHIISLALEFKGGEQFGIMIRKKDMSKFVDFHKDNGDLDIGQLVANKSLKTAVIKGADYPAEISKIFSTTSKADWSIEQEFEKNIYLLVASENIQLLKMLIAGRVDYIFDHLINNEYLDKLNIDKTNFTKLVYKRTQVGSIKDPNLIQYSVRCNRHPVAEKIVATINQLIPKLRAPNFWTNHRKKIDSNYYPPIIWTRIEEIFRNEIHKKEDQWWLKKYPLKDLLSATLEPLNKDTNNQESKTLSRPFLTPKVSREVKFWVFRDGENVVLVDPGFLSIARRKPSHILFNWNSVLMPSHLPNQFPPELRTLLAKEPNQLTFKEVANLDFKQVRDLHIISGILTPSMLKKIATRGLNLKGLNYYFGQKGIEGELVALLNKNIKKLSLVGMNFLNNPIANKVARNQLNYLNLSGSMMRTKDLQKLFVDHHDSLELLGLQFMMAELNDRTTKTFGKLPWPRLRNLNIAGARLGEDRLSRLISNLNKDLHVLRLEGNYVVPKHFQFISNHYKKLKKLSASIGFILGTEALILPPDIEFLYLGELGISEDNITSIEFPPHLEKLILNVSGGKNRSLNHKTKYLNPDLKYLELYGIRAKSPEISSFLQKMDLPNLEVLSLPSIGLSEDHLKTIADKFKKLSVLGLYNNFVTDTAITHFTNFLYLKQLDLSNNFLTSKGIGSLLALPNINSGLEYLDISNPLDLKPDKFAEKFPKNMKNLTVHGKIFPSDESVFVLKNLPASIETISWQAEFSDDESKKSLLQLIPPNARDLGYLLLKHNNGYLAQLVNSLPNSTMYLNLILKRFDLEKNHYSFPPGLISLYLSIRDSINGKFDNLLASLPFNMRYFYCDGNMAASSINTLFRTKRMSNCELTLDEVIPMECEKFSSGGLTPESVFEILNKNPKQVATTIRENKKFKFVLPNYISDSRLSALNLSGRGVNDKFADILLKMNLSNVIHFWLSHTRLSLPSMIRLLKAISQDVTVVNIFGSNIKYSQIDQLIQALPPRLNRLNISGSSFGQKGYQKFRDWRDRQKKLRGFAPLLIE